MLNKDGIKELVEENYTHVDELENNLKLDYVEVHLDETLKVYSDKELDIKKSNDSYKIIIPDEGLVLEPGILYLGRTEEYTEFHKCVPLLSGIDEIASLGMEIHITAGFGDNGFQGTWTLEILCDQKTKVYKGMVIGRIYYYSLIGDPSIEYNGKYKYQIDPMESRLNYEYQKKK